MAAEVTKVLEKEEDNNLLGKESEEQLKIKVYKRRWIILAIFFVYEAVTIEVLFYFPSEPPLPPSTSQAHLRQKKEEFSSQLFFDSIKKLFLNKPFVMHAVACAINIAVFSAIGTLQAQFILQYFEGAHEDAGRMGFIMVIAGIVASFVFGVLLDKTHMYKEITFINYLGCAVSTMQYIFMYCLEWRSLLLTYIFCPIIGIFSSAYMPVSFEFAIELTFPFEESTTTGILIAITQILGTLFTVGVGYLNLWIGCYWTLFSQGALLILGTVITGCIPNRLLRQESFRQNSIERKMSLHSS